MPNPPTPRSTVATNLALAAVVVVIAFALFAAGAFLTR